jgi:hypothetical protein
MVSDFQPLKDIAVVAGQTARFECIVQCDPHTVYWTKNGHPLESSLKHQIEYRNGVCRCTIPQASKGELGFILMSALVMAISFPFPSQMMAEIMNASHRTT